MIKNKILLLGGTGQIGQAILRQDLSKDWDLRAPLPSECDLLQPSEIGRTIQNFVPDLVINSAAMTDIESCEKNPAQAREINFHAVANIAGQCANIDAPLIQLSTDYVFDGTDNLHPYKPDDGMNPLNVYGQTKMMGEEAARHGLYWHVVLRTSLVFSAFGENVMTRTIQQIQTQNEIVAPTDQIACPTSAEALAEGIVTITNAILQGKGNGFGTFHLCGEPAISRFAFLQTLMKFYAPFTDRRPKLIPSLVSDSADGPKRPAYSALDCESTRNVYGILPQDWREDLKCAIEQYVHKAPT